MPKEKVEALSRRFNEFAKGSGTSGILYHTQFMKMICDLYHISPPTRSTDRQHAWINRYWKEIDVEKSGSINFDLFCNFYLKYFDPITGERLPKEY
jgi:hypothetical protein